jgi:acyl-CoA synthetase (AMP-forming)/AMP-acid ligase II
VAAFPVEVDGQERLVVVAEVEREYHRPDPKAEIGAGSGVGEAHLEALVQVVKRAIAEQHDVQAHDVVLLRVGTIPKTSSGKIQRRACRLAVLGGTQEGVVYAGPNSVFGTAAS